jgi:hypothetical protein
MKISPHRILTYLAIGVALSGCVTRRVSRELIEIEKAKKLTTQYLKAHLKDGGVIVFSSWKINKESKQISGEGKSYDFNRKQRSMGKLSISFSEVVVLETNDKSNNPGVATLVFLGASSGVVSFLCLVNPKACFGSCPTFFIEGDTSLRLVAEGFSSSISKSLEETDVDRIGQLLVSGQVQITMKNEALETHMVKQVNLLTVERKPDESVFRDNEGTFYKVKNLQPPAQAEHQGVSVASKIGAQDHNEWFSYADSLNLLEKEEIYLEFDNPGESAAIVLDKRQSLLTTFLFYHSLALTGGATAYYMADMENGNDWLKRRVHIFYNLLGGIEASYQDESGKWQELGTVREAGPIVSDAHLIRLPIVTQKVVHIKLRMTKGLWRIDRVNLASVVSKVEPERIQPVAVLKKNIPDTEALAQLLDRESYLVTFPGDVYTIQYPVRYDIGKEYFLESEGFYVEWMRDEWLKEQDLKLARKMLLRPAAYLKQMAPYFKRVEPMMEEVFWNSRYSNPNEK